MTRANKKQEQVKILKAFDIYYKQQSNPQYPLLLATTIQKTESQLELGRAMKMLGDWIAEYEQMSEIIKYKYFPYIGKVKAILINKFQQESPISYCISRFFICFYHSWRDFSQMLVEKLRRSDSYSLSFLWYTAQHLVSDMQLTKQVPFLQYLTTNFEEPLRHFDPQTYSDAQKILQIIYLINMHGKREIFSQHANEWALKMRLFESEGNQQSQIMLKMSIIRCRAILVCQQKSRMYWLNKVSLFLEFLEKNLPKMTFQTQLNKEIIQLFEWTIELPQVKQLLLQSQGRYMRSLMSIIKPNPDIPNYIFNNPKYSEIGKSLYNLFFNLEIKKTQNRVQEILQKFINHSFSILNDQKTYAFLDCYCQNQIVLEQKLIINVLKLLSGLHVRRTLTAKVILILAKIINASITSCPFNEEMVSICVKAFYQATIQKSTDPIIFQLRTKVAQLFYHLMKLYSWDDNNKSDMIFILCEDFEKNSKNTNPIVLQLLTLLVKKFGFATYSLHKLQPLVMEIQNKIVFDQINMHQFISLMLVTYFSIKWSKSSQLIEYVCSRNKSPLAPIYSFQAQTLIKSNSSSSEDEMKVISQILQSRQIWAGTRIKVNLMLLQMYFLRLSSAQAFKALRQVDNYILSLLEQFYEEGNYHLLAELAAKTLPSAGGPNNLEKLKSYTWIRNYSFQILARSFYKSTSIYICYIFSSIILRADHQGTAIKWLSQQQFLDYLYRGLNDFLSKQKSISVQLATTILVFKIFRLDPSLIPLQSSIPQFTTLAKNVGWWDDMEDKFCFSMLEGNQAEWLLPEFQKYYQQALIEYFKDYERNYKERKAQHIRDMEFLAQNEEDI